MYTEQNWIDKANKKMQDLIEALNVKDNKIIDFYENASEYGDAVLTTINNDQIQIRPDQVIVFVVFDKDDNEYKTKNLTSLINHIIK